MAKGWGGRLRRRGRSSSDEGWASRVGGVSLDESSERERPPEIEFIDIVKAAMTVTNAKPAETAPPEPVDLASLARRVADEQSVEPRAARVAVAGSAWNALAAESVSKGLRRSGSPDRDRVLFETALLEPTHLTPIVMTGAAALALRTGDVEPWRTRAESAYHDHRPIPGLEKAGVMIGLGFTGPGPSRSEADADGWFTLEGVNLIVHAHLYDALVVRIPSQSGTASCFLIPIHTTPGVPNGVTVTRLFGKPGTAPAAFAEVVIDGARALRVGPDGVADELLRPAINRLRCDATIVGAAQMRAAVDALANGMERRRGADVFHRLVTSDIEASVAATMAAEASQRMSARSEASKLPLVLAQHWVRSRFDAIVPDAAAVTRLADMEVSPALAWTSPLLPLWGGTRTVLRADFARLVERGELVEFIAELDVGVFGTPLGAAIDWLREIALDKAGRSGDRLEATALLWAAALLTGQGRIDAAGTLLGAEAVPMRRSPAAATDAKRDLTTTPSRSDAWRRPPPSDLPTVDDDGATDDLIVDLREIFDEDSTSGREGRPLPRSEISSH
jgi:hypothetical protein